MFKIQEENGQYVVYVKGEKAAIFPTRSEAEAFAESETKYPKVEEQWIIDSKEVYGDGSSD